MKKLVCPCDSGWDFGQACECEGSGILDGILCVRGGVRWSNSCVESIEEEGIENFQDDIHGGSLR